MTGDNASVETLVERVKAGDQAAAAAIVNRFTRRLLGLARHRLDTRIRRKVDAEDVVQSVFRSYFVRQLEDQFEVRDWDNLWSLLALITIRKCTNVKVHFRRQGRDVRRELQVAADAEASGPTWDALAREPTPDQAALLTDLIDHLLNELSESERRIVSLSLEGKSQRDISQAVQRSERTVRRTLDEFRQQLQEAMLEGTDETPTTD